MAAQMDDFYLVKIRGTNMPDVETLNSCELDGAFLLACSFLAALSIMTLPNAALIR